MSARQMALTPDLVARVHRTVEDSGPISGLIYYTEADYDAAVQEILASHPPDEDLWVFAYGSLIWRPAVEHVEERIGRAHGWHRSFCMRLVRWRGTREQPGLMMALDRGGQCTGVVLRIPGQNLEAQLGKLLRREMTVKPSTNMPRWISVETDQGRVRAIAFVVNREGAAYSGKLPPEHVADVLSQACGHMGSCADYLRKTVVHLEERRIRDRKLWQLQQLVAERIVSSSVGTTV